MEQTIKWPQFPNKIQKRGPHYYHLNKPDIDKYEEWIVLIRDPVARIKSSWIYEHPANSQLRRDNVGKFVFGNRPKFYECYPTLDEALTKGLTERSNQDNDCPMLAKKVFSGLIDEKFYGMAHHNYDFSFYFTDLLMSAAEKQIYVVRTEYMVQDLNSVDKALNGTGSAFQRTQHFNHFSKDELPMENRTVSAEGVENLCEFLCDEIQIYKRLLKRAVNFAANEYQNVLLPELAKTCPKQAAISICPEKPSIWGSVKK